MQMPEKNIHFFLPVYFDTPSFFLVRKKILSQLPAGWKACFHLIDDSAGNDPAVSVARNLPGTLILPTPQNLGHQGALAWALRSYLAQTPSDNLIVTMDADGQDRPEDLPSLISAYFKEEAARPLILARRTHRSESPTFKVCYFFYRHLFRILTGTVIDTGNYSLGHESTYRTLLGHPFFSYCYSSSLIRLAPELRFVGCARGERFEGKSKMSVFRLFTHGLRMLLPFWQAIAIRLLCFAVLVAILLLAAEKFK